MDQLLQAEQLRQQPGDVNAHTVDLRLSCRRSPTVAASGTIQRIETGSGRAGGKPRSRAMKALLTLVLQNLLGNAVKYSSSGTIKIMANNGWMAIATGWVLSVSDQGPGIAPENLTKFIRCLQTRRYIRQTGRRTGIDHRNACRQAFRRGAENRVGAQRRLNLPTWCCQTANAQSVDPVLR